MMLTMFRKAAKKKRAHSLPCDSDYDELMAWKVLREEWKKKYGMNRQFFEHLNAHANMTLDEFVKSCYAVFALFKTERGRWKVWQNVAILLFCNTKECEDFDMRPFSQSLDELLEQLVEEEVRKRVATELRIEEMKRQSDAIKD